ncbi:phage capsid protein [Yersinia kristensenii]|uniref:phage capsid protein n=1 Tax=Yersinia kristensenii TaxID=28152 RepID=UPI0011A3E311|nr:phage capsid protein [Yersinia kristensenii]
MATTAFQTMYSNEFIAGFEQNQSLVRQTVTTEGIVKGNQFVFLVADSGGATAVTRGVNGMIPARADNLNQPIATMVEWHDLVRKTGFNIFASQGDQRAIMQGTTMAVLNRKTDQDIIGELTAATQTTGAAATMSLALAMKGKVILGNNEVPADNQLFALITPAAEAYLLQTKEFASVDYVNNKPFSVTDSSLKSFSWAGINWVVHPNLPGKGTNAETCFMYHRNAIGHGMDIKGLQTVVDYDKEQDYSFARATAYMGGKLLQNKGVVKIIHDGSAFA